MDISLNANINFIKIFLVCGILSAVILGATDIIAGRSISGYRFDSHSASELSAFGMKTRPYVLFFTLVADTMLLVFSTGIWISSDTNWLLRLVACLIAGHAIFSMVGIIFFPIHLNELMNSTTNKLNVIIMFFSVLFFFLAICCGIFANHNWVRYVSLGIILIFILFTIFGIAKSGSMPGVFKERGPLVGIQERVMIYSWLLWLVCQSMGLIN